MEFEDEHQPSYPQTIEDVVRNIRADVVLGFDSRTDNEIESALLVIAANLNILSDQDRSLAIRGFRRYLKNDVTDELLKLEIEHFVASQPEGAS